MLHTNGEKPLAVRLKGDLKVINPGGPNTKNRSTLPTSQKRGFFDKWSKNGQFTFDVVLAKVRLEKINRW